MCEPLSIATIGMSAMSAGMNIMGQQQNQKAQIAYQQAQAEARNEQIIQNRTMATEAFVQQMNAENLMQAQEEQAVAEKGQDIAIKTMEAQGTAKAAAADAGVDGASLDNLLFDFNRQEAMLLGRLDLNQQFSDQARTSRVAGYGNTLKNRVTSIQPFQASPVAQVDYLTPILGMGKDSLKVADKAGVFSKPKVGDAPSTPFKFPTANSNFFG
jgi:hypothetical protein